MYANFPPERLVTELIQNAWDEDSGTCDVVVQPAGKHTMVRVSDDNPDGFKDLRHAYTLFATTSKRSDPTKRGRFNLGEKLVLARAKLAVVMTTTGKVIFDSDGRHEMPEYTEAGSVVTVTFPKWKEKELAFALEYLTWLYPPKHIKYVINGVTITHARPYKMCQCVLSTELLREVDGQAMMVKTKRKTELHFHKLRDRCDVPYLYEMGIPVCPIEGEFDIDVQQKVPLDKDRTLVPESYLQDLYAEMMNTLVDEISPDSISSASMRMALEDSRTNPETAATIFQRSYGDNAVLQSHDPDSDQEAARAGATMVSSRTFGASVNAKLRAGGVQTTKEAYCRNLGVLSAAGLPMPGGYRVVEPTPARRLFSQYVKMLNGEFFGGNIDVEFAHWTGGNAAAVHEQIGSGVGHAKVIFNVFRLGNSVLTHPVSKGTALVLHELSHAQGEGHDGVYDRAYEQSVNAHTALLAKAPERYRPFEPAIFGEEDE